VLALAALAALTAAPAHAVDGDDGVPFTFATHDCGSDDTARDVAVQPDGKVVVIGSAAGPTSDFCVVRFDTNGVLDATFGAAGASANAFDGDGESRVTFGGDDVPHSVALQDDGRIVIAGATDAPGGSEFALLRLNADGTRDTTFNDIGAPNVFNGDGRVAVDIGTTDGGAASEDVAREVLVEPNGRIFVAGDDGDDFAAMRLSSTGQLDTANFGAGDGVRVVSAGASELGEAALRQTDGRYVIAGRSTAGGGPADNFAVVRLTATGANDPDFAAGGLNFADFGADDEAEAVVQLPDGRILLAGDTAVNQDMAVAVFSQAGLPDNGFDGDGKLTIDFGGAENARDAVLTVDGKVALAGDTSAAATPNDFAVAKLDQLAAQLDTSFHFDGKRTLDSGSDQTGFAIARAPSGDLFVAGATTTAVSPDNFAVLQLIDSLPQATIGEPAPRPEGERLVFPVTLSKRSGVRVQIPYTSADGTALAGSDYNATAGVLDILAGTVNAGVSVDTQTDMLLESDERMFLNLGAATGATVSGGNAFGLITNALAAGTCANLLDGTGAGETLAGSTAGDRVNAGDGADTVNGLAGNDCLNGEAGNDKLVGNEGKDKLNGGVGNDSLGGRESSDKLYGKAGNDKLSGKDGNDVLSGGTGNDKLNGGTGKNRYSGGSGNDVIAAANGRRNEKVNCGSGSKDRATVDRGDRVTGCERVKRK
jgi:uncharacterized delta-60 repeat protein